MGYSGYQLLIYKKSIYEEYIWGELLPTGIALFHKLDVLLQFQLYQTCKKNVWQFFKKLYNNIIKVNKVPLAGFLFLLQKKKEFFVGNFYVN